MTTRTLSTYLSSLVDIAAATQSDHLAQQQDEQARVEQAARERLTPLEARLKRVLADIPNGVQLEGISLPTIQTMLKGRWRGNCHPGELGRALRHLGYTRERRWRGETDGFKALWFPPTP